MTIVVETSGPIGTAPPVVGPSASTFSDLILQIADEIDDTTGEYSSQITAACYGAIRYCERDVYYFNETRDVTFSTVAGQQWYGAADNANIPTLVRVIEAYCERADGERSRMGRSTPTDMGLVSDNSASQGEPDCWTYFGQRIRLYPIPDQAYTIRLQLGPYRLSTITNVSDSNAWTMEAFDLLKARAKFILYKDIIKDAVLAAEALNDYEDQHRALKAETSRRNGSGCIRATAF